ncbi:MAG: YraN family protein [Lachnospiraceae bacterium]|nr:YraN family protein [Lachnospiraceae bacterium]
MKFENTKKAGNAGENLACEFLKDQGLRIIERNFKASSGEIDIIAVDAEGTICFIEVKYREHIDNGLPMEAVNRAKQRRICRTSDHYRAENSLSEEFSYRFDVISIAGETTEWIKNAFEYIPRR